ncbi:CHASE3 domain-containing protein [Sphingomonas nostoxanthinifaciens]|uniref:CHASE3 domain-containing protein n=1 Tax=Sphingomonas nostoxanthinifaciens TaxID=2872652 RepID=UPI001CC1C9CA|nr:CHASE3 domain-containing protein [Sphingomonas nostoxanthinifaciens]UAK24878.1 CHASE3 domain-containing protein [Sphingomonas nostoxanthinifaciens]
MRPHNIDDMPRATLRRVPLMPLAGLAITVVAGIAALVLSFGVARANHWIAHSIRTQVGIIAVGERLSAYESGFRGYLVRRNPSMLDEAETARTDLQQRLVVLAHETADDPVQRQRAAELARLIAARVDGAEELIHIRARGTIDSLPAISRTRLLMDRIRAQIAAMFGEEERRLAVRQRWLQTLTVGLALFLVGAVLVVVVVAYLTVSDAAVRYAELEQAHDETRVEMQKREMAESQLRQMQKMETIGQLAGGIAHDFNNMLAIIIGNLDMARRHQPDQPERVSHGIATALDGAARAAALVRRLLAVSRNQPLSPMPIDANQLIESMSDLLRRTLGERFTVETAPTEALWTCFADPVQLESALLNLAVNARDAMQARGGRLTLTAENVVFGSPADGTSDGLLPGDYVGISVGDTGDGMPPALIERAFDPFFTTKEVGKGTGLGLSQVLGFVRQSGGDVTITSRVGAGTIVRLLLPRHHGAVAPVQPISTRIAARANTGETILVVEDEPHVRHFSADALSELGYTVLAASNGAEALQLIERPGEIALLFTDMVMPGLSGRALAEQARQMRPGLRVLYTTGYARDEGEAASVGTILPKPFTMAQLAQKVRAALDAH